MKKVFTVLRQLFGSKPSRKNDYLVWAKTEYKSDWQFAYQHMLDHNGAAPTLARTYILGTTAQNQIQTYKDGYNDHSNT